MHSDICVPFSSPHLFLPTLNGSVGDCGSRSHDCTPRCLWTGPPAHPQDREFIPSELAVPDVGSHLFKESQDLSFSYRCKSFKARIVTAGEE